MGNRFNRKMIKERLWHQSPITEVPIKLEIDTIDVAEGLKTFEIDISGVETLYIHSDLKDGGSIFIPLTTSYYK